MEAWLKRFKLRYEFLDLDVEKKAHWWRSVIGPHIQEAIMNTLTNVNFATQHQLLIISFGTKDEARDDQDALHGLTLGKLILKQLVVCAPHLQCPVEHNKRCERDALCVTFLLALPVSPVREVEITPMATLDAAQTETERQQLLVKEYSIQPDSGGSLRRTARPDHCLFGLAKVATMSLGLLTTTPCLVL